jgi:hypothetical protein
MKPYDVLYIEEPAVPGNIEVFKRLKQHIPIPLAVGEQARHDLGRDCLPFRRAVRIFCKSIALTRAAFRKCARSQLGGEAALKCRSPATRDQRPGSDRQPTRRRDPAVPHPRVLPKHFAAPTGAEGVGGRLARTVARRCRLPGMGREIDEGQLAELAKNPSPPNGPLADCPMARFPTLNEGYRMM